MISFAGDCTEARELREPLAIRLALPVADEPLHGPAGLRFWAGVSACDCLAGNQRQRRFLCGSTVGLITMD